MKVQITLRIIGCIISTFCFTVSTFAQEFSTKYGKVTDDELAMTTYAPDTTASAVVLFKKGVTFYEIIADDFRVNYHVEKKIKVLKPEGSEYADVVIRYYNNESHPNRKEIVTQIEAVAYNVENGKVVKTKMSKDYIFRERINNNYMQVKFSVPAVKEGTVIEYKYKILSDLYSWLYTWEMQEDIPVVHSSYDLTMLEYFRFNMEMRGKEKIDLKEKNSSVALTLTGGYVVRPNSRNLIFTGNNLPAVKGDSYVWCAEDYISKITFELLGVDFPGQMYRSFTSDWAKIDELLFKDEDFGRLLKMRNPFKDEMILLGLDRLSANEKIARIFCFLKQKISWNGKYALFGGEGKKAIKEGTTDNAELNFILISMLKDAGFTAYPVIMSRRDRGIIPYTHPSIDKINTFVVGVQNSDSTTIYLDGSIEHGFFNVLPPVLLTNRARIVSEAPGEKWVNLTRLTNNQRRSLITATINENGELEGTRNDMYSGQYAATYRQFYKSAKDSLEYIEKKEAEENIKILSCKQEEMLAFSPDVKEYITFTKSISSGGDYLYINPMIFKHIDKNPFIQESRDLPIEYPYSYIVRQSVSITIPKGYQVEELPKQNVINMENNSGNCRYLIQHMGNTITLTYQCTLNDIFYAQTDYLKLKSFWENVAEKNNEMIVLKKVAL